MSRITATALAPLRDQLTSLKAELNALLDATAAGVRPVALDEPIGRLSRIDAIQQQKLAQANRHRSEVRLQQVMAALRALDAGTYGECRRCDEPIGIERLTAMPETPVCMECQEELESQ